MEHVLWIVDYVPIKHGQNLDGYLRLPEAILRPFLTGRIHMQLHVRQILHQIYESGKPSAINLAFVDRFFGRTHWSGWSIRPSCTNLKQGYIGMIPLTNHDSSEVTMRSQYFAQLHLAANSASAISSSLVSAPMAPLSTRESGTPLNPKMTSIQIPWSGSKNGGVV